MNPFSFGLSRTDKDRLDNAEGHARALDNLYVVPPLNVTRGVDGQVVIGMGAAGAMFSGCKYWSGTSGQTINAASSTKITTGTSLFDTDDYYNSVTNRFYFPSDGYYAAGCQVSWSNSATSNLGARRIQISPIPFAESGVYGSVQSYQNYDINESVQQQVAAVGYADAGSYIEFWASQNSTAPLDIHVGGAIVWIYKIG